MSRKIVLTKAFNRGYKRMIKRGKDKRKLETVLNLLANDEALEKRYADHALTGNFSHCRECHIELDWLLIYQFFDEGDRSILRLNDTGSHSDLFD
ncbi:MAG: type II toxin-antitoxin system YafQ family toxin [Chloroflexota bacterium]|jgi:mRNA interferase YafQ